ncbi:MAG: hypothetical protein ACREK7_04395, partial [Gemmatimonadota bacterium]
QAMEGTMQWKIGLITAALSIGACEGSGGGGGPTDLPEISEPAAVARIEVTPQRATTLVGGTVQFAATAFDRHGNALGRAVIWQAMNVSVTDISQGGLAHAKGVGTSAVRASVGDVIGFAQLDVTGERKPTPRDPGPQE